MRTQIAADNPLNSTTMTVRLPSELKEGLSRLAARTRRSKSFLAGEAIAAYVARELEIIEGIERGLDDMKAGRVVPHDEAMRRIRAVIEKAR
ncbi:MAG: CopG family ribbon-helix-helix protein [Rhodospirillales bacterium]|nr:CopG family ribbon-helix-helix protein [Rhodospirillales bacterium]